MARIVSKEESGLVLSADGRWIHRGDAATHRGVSDFFHRQIRRDDSGHYYLYNSIAVPEKGITLEEHVYFEVEDTAYFVRHIEFDADGGHFEVKLDRDQTLTLAPGSLLRGAEDQLYLRLSDGELARFDRHAMSQLDAWLEADGDELALASGDVVLTIGRR